MRNLMSKALSLVTMIGVFSLASVGLSACSSTPSHGAAAPAASGSAASAVPAAGSEFFYGTSKFYPQPSDSPLPSATRQVLVRRSFDPASSRITETMVTEGPAGSYEEYTAVMTVSGGVFTMEERGGSFRGQGTLTGPPWRWTAWTSHAVMPDGAVVDASDTLSGDKLLVDKTFKGPHGTIHMVEEYKRIDRPLYNSYRALLGVAPDMTP